MRKELLYQGSTIVGSIGEAVISFSEHPGDLVIAQPGTSGKWCGGKFFGAFRLGCVTWAMMQALVNSHVNWPLSGCRKELPLLDTVVASSSLL